MPNTCPPAPLSKAVPAQDYAQLLPEEAEGGLHTQRMKLLAAYKFEPRLPAHAGGRAIWAHHLVFKLAAERRQAPAKQGAAI